MLNISVRTGSGVVLTATRSPACDHFLLHASGRPFDSRPGGADAVATYLRQLAAREYGGVVDFQAFDEAKADGWKSRTTVH